MLTAFSASGEHIGGNRGGGSQAERVKGADVCIDTGILLNCVTESSVAPRCGRRRVAIRTSSNASTMLNPLSINTRHFMDIARFNFRKSRRAFTLLELLVCIAIIGILSALAFAGFSKLRASADVTRCLSNLRQIGNAMMLYTSDNNGSFPEMWTSGKHWSENPVWNDRLNPYLGLRPWNPYDSSKSQRFYESKVWSCPSAKSFASHERHYALNRYMNPIEEKWNYKLANVPTPARIIAVAEINQNSDTVFYKNMESVDFTGKVTTNYRVSHHDGAGANYVFCDGHAEYLTGVQSDLNPETSPWKWW